MAAKYIGKYTLEKSIDTSEIIISGPDKETKHTVPSYIFRDIWPVIDSNTLLGHHFIAGLRTSDVDENMFLLNIYLGLYDLEINESQDDSHIYEYYSSNHKGTHPITVSKKLINSSTHKMNKNSID